MGDNGSLEVCAALFRRFMLVSPDDTVELTLFDSRKKVSVAYARSEADQVRLMREADARADVSGVYTVFNRIHDGLYARIGDGRWVPFASRASDNDVTAVVAVYLDFDCVRPRDISSTDDEKRAAYDASFECEQFLSTAFGTDWCLGRGDSGNGYSLFVALDPIAPSDDTRKRIEKFLKAMASKFNTPRVKVDSSVCNPARLCPAFGTRKRKGVDCESRPHRGTHFCCRGSVVRLPIEAL
jgi:hypothetical protein